MKTRKTEPARLEVWNNPPDHLCRCEKCREPMRELVSRHPESGRWYCRSCVPAK